MPGALSLVQRGIAGGSSRGRGRASSVGNGSWQEGALVVGQPAGGQRASGQLTHAEALTEALGGPFEGSAGEGGSESEGDESDEDLGAFESASTGEESDSGGSASGEASAEGDSNHSGHRDPRLATARAKANARARRSEAAARNGSAPLLAQPLEPGIWGAALPHAMHVLYAQLPHRPDELRGKFLLGWQPPNFQWQSDPVAHIKCLVCSNGEDAAGNDILLCDGKDCNAAYHMGCLTPALTSVPRGRWFCPDCTVAQKAQQQIVRRQQREQKARQEVMRQEQRDALHSALSPYEKQRLDNIARNQEVLATLGLADSTEAA